MSTKLTLQDATSWMSSFNKIESGQNTDPLIHKAVLVLFHSLFQRQT
jgi:hypothetical protein